MRNQLLKDDILGSYTPSFFEMYVNTPSDDLTITNLSPKDRTTFFHEYIHFMQDFSTMIGLNNLYIHSEYIHSVVNRAYNTGGRFSVPVPIDDNLDMVQLNKHISNLVNGDATSITPFQIKSLRIEQSQIFITNPYLPKIESCFIETFNGDYCVFGAIAIMESMAYLMEQLCAPNDYEKSPEFPYDSAEKVAQFLAPEIAGDKMIILALCDVSLQVSNPGVFFIQALHNIHKKNWAINKPEDIYDFLYNELHMKNVQTKQVQPFIDCFEEKVNHVMDLIKTYLKDLQSVQAFYTWIDNLRNFAIDWRKNRPYYLLQMASCNDLLKNSQWGELIHKVGSPLICNEKGNYFKIPSSTSNGDMDVEYFRAIREIEKLFEFGQKQCTMMSWCHHSPGSTPNDLCEYAPWEKCKEERLCPYAFLWKHWKLASYEPKF